MGYAMKDSAMGKNATSFLDTLNNATTTSPINGSTVNDLAPMLKFAVQSQDARKASLVVWQVAGVLIQRGRGPESLNWAGGALAAKGRARSRTSYGASPNPCNQPPGEDVLPSFPN